MQSTAMVATVDQNLGLGTCTVRITYLVFINMNISNQTINSMDETQYIRIKDSGGK